MRLIRITIIFIILIGLYFLYKYRKVEPFTVYELDYGTGIGPWWAQGPGLNRGYNRCICSGTGDCRCINDTQFENTSVYPQYYFN
jgi:hypothetical protein